MAPHLTQVVAIRRRTLAVILDDIREARRDYDDALAETDADAEDRATEAETRLEDLREEFATAFARGTGLTVEGFRAAFADALV